MNEYQRLADAFDHLVSWGFMAAITCMGVAVMILAANVIERYLSTRPRGGRSAQARGR